MGQSVRACMLVPAVLLALLWCPGDVSAQLVAVPDPLPGQELKNGPIARLKAVTPRDARAWRKKVRSVLWGAAPPAAGRVTVGAFGHDIASIIGRTPKSAVWLDYPGDGTAPSRAIFVLMTRAKKGDCLFLYHAGHRQGFVVQEGDTYTTAKMFFPDGARNLLHRVAARGCDLLLFSMPFAGENRNPSNPYAPTHDELGRIKPPNGSALRYFIDPVVAMLDYVTATRSYNRIAMAGLSGGGWTTTVVAAIEPRITHTYAVAGTLPNYLRKGKDLGDWEQTGATELWGLIDYLDLYLMAVTEPSRRATHFWLRHDTCCFKADLAAEFAGSMRRHARQRGFGQLHFFADTGYAGHDVSEVIADRILMDLWAGRVRRLPYRSPAARASRLQ